MLSFGRERTFLAVNMHICSSGNLAWLQYLYPGQAFWLVFCEVFHGTPHSLLMQHVLLVSFVLGCVTAARIDTRDSVRRDQEDPEPVNLDRITCLREDNLDLVGAADAADRYFLRKVVGTSNEETHGDIYIFGEQLQIKSLEAKVSFHRADADSFEFELSGDRTTGKHGEYSGLGIAEVWISGFEVMTKNKLVNWATAMATNRDVLREGQDGTLYFSLSGKVRAKNVKGVWTAELVSKEVKYFKFNFNSCLDYVERQAIPGTQTFSADGPIQQHSGTKLGRSSHFEVLVTNHG